MKALTHLWSGQLDGIGAEGDRPALSEEVEFAQRIVAGVEANMAGIDEIIEKSSTNWRIQRMPIVDRNILRMAAFELMECPDIPASVSVNEAVELAKTFGTAESRSFVNGIVDKVGRQIGRLAPRKGKSKARD